MQRHRFYSLSFALSNLYYLWTISSPLLWYPYSVSTRSGSYRTVPHIGSFRSTGTRSSSWASSWPACTVIIYRLFVYHCSAHDNYFIMFEMSSTIIESLRSLQPPLHSDLMLPIFLSGCIRVWWRAHCLFLQKTQPSLQGSCWCP